MAKPWRLHPAAESELRQAARWYERERAGLGFELVAEVDHVRSGLEALPARGAAVPGLPAALGVRRALLRRFPYELVYVELGDHYEVIAVGHQRRRPGYWLDRLGGRK
jgi:plasmid stabilization system protein ParE